MNKILSVLKLNKEANLLDSKMYIIKTFLAVATAYIWSAHNPILKRDTISVLFGLMLTLEPVTLTGVKNGWDQIYASLLGALSTVIIVYIGGGINAFTIALSIAFTLFVCLKINWRMVSPVAIFTSIYMTQYIQKTASGAASMALTFRLRMAALGAGVLVAVMYNFIFSFVSYKQMLNKRVLFLIDSIYDNLQATSKAIKENNMDKIYTLKSKLPQDFNNIDWVMTFFMDMKKEAKFKLKISKITMSLIEKYENMVLTIRTINHLNYDICYTLCDECRGLDISEENRDKIANSIKRVLNKLDILKNSNGAFLEKIDVTKKQSHAQGDDEKLQRVFHDVETMINIVK
ncbi:MAG: conserved rane protein of unknown function [Clostridiaceae bacterium]|jgi:hypothetical protein|nr:conserved rane protein of unknown function [Clostridiaceae bacterium]